MARLTTPIKLAACLILAGLASTVITASPGSCYAIKDPAFRQQCLAETQRSTSHCYSIQDRDQKNYCLATVSGNRSYCYSIDDRDKRSYCLAR